MTERYLLSYEKCGETTQVGYFKTMEEATAHVEDWDQKFVEWTERLDPDDNVPPPSGGAEGCDFLLYDTEKNQLLLEVDRVWVDHDEYVLGIPPKL